MDIHGLYYVSVESFYQHVGRWVKTFQRQLCQERSLCCFTINTVLLYLHFKIKSGEDMYYLIYKSGLHRVLILLNYRKTTKIKLNKIKKLIGSWNCKSHGLHSFLKRLYHSNESHSGLDPVTNTESVIVARGMQCSDWPGLSKKQVTRGSIAWKLERSNFQKKSCQSF